MFSYAVNLLKSGIVLEGDRLEDFCEWLLNGPEHICLSEIRALMGLTTNDPDNTCYLKWRERLMRWRSPDGIKPGPLAQRFIKAAHRVLISVYCVEIGYPPRFREGDMVSVNGAGIYNVVSVEGGSGWVYRIDSVGRPLVPEPELTLLFKG